MKDQVRVTVGCYREGVYNRLQCQDVKGQRGCYRSVPMDIPELFARGKI